MRLTPIRMNMCLKIKRKRQHKKVISMKTIKTVTSDIRIKTKEVSWMHTYRKPE